VIDEYQATTLKLQSQVNLAQEGLGRWLNRLAWLLTFLLVWLGIMQIGLLMQGWQLLEAKREPILAADDRPLTTDD
jgi:hypothetical protein